jgi:hypothetical protein
MKSRIVFLAVFLLLCSFSFGVRKDLVSAQSTQSGSIGLEGRVPAKPPAKAPTITFPRNGATITDIPVTVTGLCESGLLIKIFKNGVFGGSAICKNGSYSIQIDLFIGVNELIARAYDDLDQASPDSNKVRVTLPASQFSVTNRISLSSSFAKRGANPGDKLTWPITLNGGTGPYAISVDWGDGTEPDIISREFAGNFEISHIYENAGIYNILIRATDKNGDVAFLQLVGVGNGELNQDQAGAGPSQVREIIKILWLPIIFLAIMALVAFWLGKRHQIRVLRRRLSKRDSF